MWLRSPNLKKRLTLSVGDRQTRVSSGELGRSTASASSLATPASNTIVTSSVLGYSVSAATVELWCSPESPRKPCVFHGLGPMVEASHVRERDKALLRSIMVGGVWK